MEQTVRKTKTGKGSHFIKYHTDDERKRAIRASKTKYMLKKEWYCDVCKNNKDYKMAGKWNHINTGMHAAKME